jgi:hypothetical protein
VDGDEQDEATAGWADDAHTNAAAGRACRSAGDPAAATSGTRTAVRRSTGVASGARRSAEKAAGRPARTRGRNGNG